MQLEGWGRQTMIASIPLGAIQVGEFAAIETKYLLIHIGLKVQAMQQGIQISQ